MNIQFNNVSCKLENKHILQNISLSFDTQGIFTFIGQNGTGKSTFLSLLSGLITPNSGSITADGEDIQANIHFRQSLIYLTNDLYTEFNDTITTIINRYQSFGKEGFKEQLLNMMLRDFNVDPNTKLSTLSTGEKKIHIFIAHMAFAPTTIILDEYLDGVDVIHHKLFAKYLYYFCDTYQAKVFIVTHHAHDIYMLSDDIFLIRDKHVQSIGHIENIISKYNAMQVSSDASILTKLEEAGIVVVHFEQVGRIATITYKTDTIADDFWHAQTFQYCEQTAIPIERVIEYEFIN